MKAALFAAGFLSLIVATASAQAPGEMALYEKLTHGPGAAKALDAVLAKADRVTPVMLFTSAGVAFKEKRLDESAFLFYAAQLRSRFDEECFPPQETGANDPFLACGALSEELGSVINPAVMAEPKAFAKSLARLKEWSPKAVGEYDPGYKFTARKTEKEAAEGVQSSRTEFLSRMSDLSALLSNGEYFAAFRVVQTYNSAEGKNRPSDADNDRAMETMMRIEREKGLKGVFSE